MSRTGGHFDFLACGVRVFLERDERTRGLEKTADGFFRLSIFFKTLPSFQNFGGKKNCFSQAGDKETNEKHDEDNNEESKRRRRYC